MKNNELLKKVCRYLNPYPQNHYDQIQREVQTEILHQLEISNLFEQLKNN